jgi:MFS family permease
VSTTHRAAGGVLATLAAAQFLMTLDSSVMNVSMATVAEDVDTTITGIQTAITLYTLVMASLMITGGKIGSIIGRRRAFALGCAIYGVGSLVTGLAPSLPVLLFGWSLLEGIGAALIMPAVVALVAGNFAIDRRPQAYGLIASAGAIAVAVGPLLGGLATTYVSWRLVFFAEVGLGVVVLALSRRMHDVPVERGARLDVLGTLLSIVGLGAIVFGVLRTSEWGWITPKEGGPALLGLSPSFWLVAAGGVVVWAVLGWQRHLEATEREPLLRPSMLANTQLTGGLIMFAFQFLLQAGVFFTIPLFLSVVLELSAIDTGLRIMPLSLSLLVAAAGVPRLFPTASPRLIVRIGILLMLAGIVTLMSGIELDAPAGVVMMPLLLVGLGIGALSSQLGAVAVSAVPTSQSAEVGGLQNTATNLGASLGTALAGSVLIAALSASLISGIQASDTVPEDFRVAATTQLASGVPFVSDSALRAGLDEAGVEDEVADTVVAENAAARVEGLDAALGVLALLAVVALGFTRRIPAAPASGPLESDPVSGGAPGPEA